MLSTTKLSSKGQIVIPEEIRKKLNLSPGDQFLVIGENDVLVLKTIKEPTLDEFDNLIKDARKEARTAGFKKDDLNQLIKDVRKKDKKA